MSRPRRLSVAAIALVTTGLLAGCGETHPGVAVRVGDRQVPTSEVADLTTAYCDAVADAGAQPVSLRSVQESVVSAVAARTAVDAFAAPYDVTPGPAYTRAVNAQRAQLGDLDEEARDAVVTVATVSDYLQALTTAVAEQKGASGAGAAEEGQRLFAAWLQEHRVVLNPRYGLELRDDQMHRVDASLSVPVSAVARQDKDGGSSDVASLPPAQRCG